MDKDLGIKVTVTRLRRRLSVESEDSNSPPAPSTPSKKRGGRLATKPQLELIDEDVNESVPKRTPRKSVARDAVEPEEKVMTPARRSTRIRSNTSLLAEVTSVTPKVTDSPRAKRAARRNSQLESDNETPVAAPLRQTRRTRKNSTTSVDIIENDNQTPVAKQTKTTTKSSTPSANEKAEIAANDDNLIVYVVTVTDAATEKESNNNTKSNEKDDESSPTIRKSPRLKDKLEKKTPDNKDGKSKDDNSFQLLEEPTQSAEIVNNVTPEKTKLDDALTISLSIDEGTVTSTADSNTVNNKIKESEASKNITLPVQIITNEDNTKEDEIVIKTTHLNKSKLDIQEKLSISSYDEQYEKSDVEKLLENDPRIMQSVVVIDDSDSNSGKLVMDIPHEGEDQCVPVVHSNDLVKDVPKTSEEPEPMDIDESIPLNVTLNDFEQFVKSNTEPINQTTELPKNNSFELKSTAKANASNPSLNNSKRTSSVSVPSENINEQNDSKSKRKSSISISLESCFQNIDMDTVNKSKRTSYSEINNSLQASNKSSPKSNKENQTLNQKLQKSRKSSIRCTDDENNSPAIINKSNGKPSKSLSVNSKVKSPKTYENKNKSRNSSRLSETAENIDINSKSENQANKSKVKSALKEETQDPKSLINIEDNSLNESRKKNKSSTTVAQADTQNLEKSTNENKSTLLLSQLKDISTNDTKNASKPPDEFNNELSKSITDIAKNAKNNITNVLTSTPLQQKSIQKLGMQINTSIISPNAGNKSVDMKINKKASPAVESSDSDSSDEENVGKNKSKMIDDEASEASEDYESGDSRDDDERQYEIENEIVEKGETLESDQDFSNDSDYEKDSFVVSSDAEDDEKLSGTGNDLSFSDTELTMSKKSKKKFDERKRKEQKTASREMFEARHGLNRSNNDSKLDKIKSKKKAKQLESSESENETERPKKKNRMRIDSSHDDSVLKSDADESIGHKKKKTKRLSESVCEDNMTVNEKEITICNENVSNKNDPLSAAIKLEPKTPQKDFNISTVPIVDKIEEVEVGDMTVINSNETLDPLQTTMVAQDDDSVSSDNMEIMQNYDSVLNNLNNQRKVKTLDMSLNIENKSGAKPREPIIDQLNLTHTKKDKKNKSVNKSLDEKEKSKNANKNVSKVVQDEESSDCIDMELLFPEDSNDSEDNVNKINQDKSTVTPAEEYIPLKKTEGKTHIPETMSTSTSLNNSKLNKSKSKKEKNSSQIDTGDSSEPTDSLNFFVDVTGDLELSNSKKKNKKKYFNEEQDRNDSKQSNSIIEDKDVQNVTVNDEAPTEMSFKSDKKKKKKHKHLNTSANESFVSETELNNVAEREADVNNEDQIKNKVSEPDQSLNISVKSDKKKKENKNLDVSNIESPGVESETQSAKKKSKKSLEKLIDDNVNIEDTGTEDTEIPEKSFNTEKKKQKKKHNTSDANSDNTQDLTQVTEQTVRDNTQVTEQNPDNLDTSLKTEKKKKKKHKNRDVSLSDQSLGLEELFGSKTVEQTEVVMLENTNKDTSLKSEKKKKKKHENRDLVQEEQNVQSNEQEMTSLDTEVVTSSKKKKKHKVKDTTKQAEDSDDAPEEVSFQFEKATVEEIKEQKAQKRKLETVEAQGAVQADKSKKKRKLSDKVEKLGDQGDKNVTQKASKKRKRQEAETELEEKKAKVSKEHSLDKIHIPRLPLSVLEQLDDEPQIPKKKAKAIATSEFIVEDARSRKNKPSTYLEQSVYLNDTPKKNKKKQKLKKNPVLPFIPTAETSDKGFTSNFRINVVSDTPFVASNTGNFKTDYLAQQRIKKLGSFERFKTQRSHKLCKF